MSEPVVYLNDGFVPASQAHINIYDLGIVLGATLTEMTRTFRHEPFRLEEHMRRLLRSCKYAGIELALDHEGLVECTRTLIQTNSEADRSRSGFGSRPLCNAGGKPDLRG